MMSPRTVRKPDRRECERCGRVERWDADLMAWRIAIEDETKRVGNTYCIHEWDINGSFRPFE